MAEETIFEREERMFGLSDALWNEALRNGETTAEVILEAHRAELDRRMAEAERNDPDGTSQEWQEVMVWWNEIVDMAEAERKDFEARLARGRERK